MTFEELFSLPLGTPLTLIQDGLRLTGELDNTWDAFPLGGECRLVALKFYSEDFPFMEIPEDDEALKRCLDNLTLNPQPETLNETETSQFLPVAPLALNPQP